MNIHDRWLAKRSETEKNMLYYDNFVAEAVVTRGGAMSHLHSKPELLRTVLRIIFQRFAMGRKSFLK